MSTRSDDAQAVLLHAAAEAADAGHLLRAWRLLHDCWRLGPMSAAHRADYDALLERVDPLRAA